MTKEKTKEEILYDNAFIDGISIMSNPNATKHNMYKAMDTFANQEKEKEAIFFGRWLGDNCWIHVGDGNYYNGSELKDSNEKTLYSMYLKEKEGK